MKRVLPVLAILCSVWTTRAELPPSAYEALQSEAPDVFAIEVLDVKKHAGPEAGDQDIQVVAQIVDVKRSSSGSTAGSLIHILFTIPRRPPGFVGPAPVPVPARGDRSPAYLRPLGKPGDFAPAAGAMTFREF